MVAQTAGELGRRKLQTQGQKQQHDTDGRTGSDELTGGGHPKMPPLPNDKPANKYTGIGDNANRRATAPSTASTANRTPSSNNSALETSTGSALFDDLFDPGDPSSVPITMRTSPARSTSVGPGEANTSSSRTIATIDAPVRVRARVSPSGRSTNKLPARM